MYMRGIRGAITSDNNEKSILDSTKKLLNEIFELNLIKKNDIASIIFTMTDDLDAAFPARAAREIGLSDVPLICSRELDIEGSLAKCIRVLIHYNTEKSNSDIVHVYLSGAKVLRPDLVKEEK